MIVYVLQRGSQSKTISIVIQFCRISYSSNVFNFDKSMNLIVRFLKKGRITEENFYNDMSMNLLEGSSSFLNFT